MLDPRWGSRAKRDEVWCLTAATTLGWWIAGTAMNDSHSDHAYWSEAHKECSFEAGEVRWISTPLVTCDL